MNPQFPLSLRRPGLWLAVIWLAVFTLVFFIIRNPLAGAAANQTISSAQDLLAVLLLVWLSGAAGALIVPGLDRVSALERAAIQALIGLGTISLFVLFLGLIGAYPPGWAVWAILIGGLVGLHRVALRWFYGLRDGLRDMFRFDDADLPASLRRVGFWVIGGCVALLVLMILPSFAPVTSWDALVYHLAGPKIYIEAGRIVPFDELHFLGFPFLTEMLYLCLMLIARPQAAALLHAVFGLLTGLLLLGRARAMNRPVAGWIALFALLINNEMQVEFHTAQSDLSATAYMTAGLWLALSAFDGDNDPDRRSLLWSGVLVGLGLGTKYTAVSAAVGVGFATLWLARGKGLKRMISAGATLTIPAILTFAPWMIKNALMYGNPVAPFVWGTPGFDQLDQSDYLHAGAGLSPGEMLVFPLIFTFLGGVGDWYYYGSPGPLLPGLLPFALFGWKDRPRINRTFTLAAMIFACAGAIYWISAAAVTSNMNPLRLVYPFFPAIALAGGLALDDLSRMVLPIQIDRIGRAAVVLTVILAPVLVLAGAIQFPEPYRAVFGQINEEDYLDESLPAFYDAVQQVNALPPGSRVLMLWESRTFYCERECIPDTLLNQWRHDLLTIGDAHEVVEYWRAEDIDYVLICDAGMNAVFTYNERGPTLQTEDDVKALEDVRQTELKLVWDDSDGFGAYSLYEIP